MFHPINASLCCCSLLQSTVLDITLWPHHQHWLKNPHGAPRCQDAGSARCNVVSDRPSTTGHVRHGALQGGGHPAARGRRRTQPARKQSGGAALQSIQRCAACRVILTCPCQHTLLTAHLPVCVANSQAACTPAYTLPPWLAPIQPHTRSPLIPVVASILLSRLGHSVFSGNATPPIARIVKHLEPCHCLHITLTERP
jgi:hypothetical protein